MPHASCPHGPASQADAPASIPPARLQSAAFLHRRELFCQHYAAGAGGAEAVRRSGYSPNGAKQRACVLLRQPEIRLRIEALRAEHRSTHQRHLAEAVATMDGIIKDAVRNGKSAVTLRAVEFKLKLLGVIGGKRISHYSYSPSPDADLENLEPNRGEEFDGLPGFEYHLVPPGVAAAARAAALVPKPATPAETVAETVADGVTKDDPTPEPASDPAPVPEPAIRVSAAVKTIDGTVTMNDPMANDPMAGSGFWRVLHAAKRMTCDDHPAADPASDLDDLIAQSIVPPAALVPECRPS